MRKRDGRGSGAVGVRIACKWVLASWRIGGFEKQMLDSWKGIKIRHDSIRLWICDTRPVCVIERDVYQITMHGSSLDRRFVLNDSKRIPRSEIRDLRLFCLAISTLCVSRLSIN